MTFRAPPCIYITELNVHALQSKIDFYKSNRLTLIFRGARAQLGPRPHQCWGF